MIASVARVARSGSDSNQSSSTARAEPNSTRAAAASPLDPAREEPAQAGAIGRVERPRVRRRVVEQRLDRGGDPLQPAFVAAVALGVAAREALDLREVLARILAQHQRAAVGKRR